MHQLRHFRLCPLSRSIRLILSELELEAEFAEEQPWSFKPEFLALNPSGELPVLLYEKGPCLCGAYSISEFLADEMRRRPPGSRLVACFPGNREERAEVRRLVDWFHRKLDREVTRELLIEKVYSRMDREASRSPDVEILRGIATNLRYHMGYINYLAQGRNWLAGEDLSFADFAGAAHVSVIDYLGEVPWDDFPFAKDWYARIKSRPSMRPLLADKLAGIAPPAHYTDLDF